MPLIIGIFTFINRENFMLSWVEHEISFITTRPDKLPSRHTISKWRRINVDATWSRRIDVDTTSFWYCVPAGLPRNVTPYLIGWISTETKRFLSLPSGFQRNMVHIEGKNEKEKWRLLTKEDKTSEILMAIKENLKFLKIFRFSKYSWLSLSRPRLSRITAYLEVKIWSLPIHENLTTDGKYCRKEEKLLLWSNFSSFPQYFQYISNFKSPITYQFVKCG